MRELVGEVTEACVRRWIWAYWLSPFAYSLRAVAINEMTSPAWGPVGIQALESFGFQTERCLRDLLLCLVHQPCEARALAHQL